MKAVKTTLIPRFTEGIVAIKLTPEVNSIIPEVKGIMKFGFIFKIINGVFKIS